MSENQINNRVKPCPFCGNKATLNDERPMGGHLWATCDECIHGLGDGGWVKAEVWNKRYDR